MEKLIADYFNSKNIAVVGASTDKSKFGYRVFKLLKMKGYNAIPVNPKIEELDGVKAYPDIASIEGDIDAVSFIIPPDRAMPVLEQIKERGIDLVWFQPGAESYKLTRYCESNDIRAIYHRCVLVEAERF